jgi:acetoacetate decarboxylase
MSENTWSTPKLAPLYPNFPIEYRDVEILTTIYRSDPQAISQHLIDPVVAASDLVMIHCYQMPDVMGMGKVEESNVMVGVTVPVNGGQVAGGFSTNLIISSDVGLAQGREIHGQPKKLGNTKIEVRGDTIVAEIERNGITLARITTPYKYSKATVAEISEYFSFQNNINHKVIRNIDGTQGINQISSRTLANVVVRECWKGPTTVVLEPNINAALYRLPVLESVESFYWKADFDLVPGIILIDYLKNN